MNKNKQIAVQKEPSIVDSLNKSYNSIIKAFDSFDEWYEKNIPLNLEHSMVGILAAIVGYAVYLYTGYILILYAAFFGIFVSLTLLMLYYTSPYSPYKEKQK
jgi:type IV secretory pathway VirB6-like protein